ncbi:MAG: hypothetical protein ACREBC_20090 [Pyrinomonadaceae bacterium]
MGDQASSNRSKALAAARGGARAGKPRWVRILVVTGGCSMAAMIFKARAKGVVVIYFGAFGVDQHGTGG